MIKDRWKHGAIPALMIHGCIGTVYCWSLLSDALNEKLGTGYGWAFSLAIFFLGLSAAFLGPFVEKDVKKASRYSALLFGTGMILSGIACWLGSLTLFFLGYGVIMGIGLGLGYLSPVKTLMLWFSDNKGLATGLAISGFGLAKVLATPSFEYVMNNYGITAMFLIHGVIYTAIMLVGSRFLKKPEGTESKIKGNFSVSAWYNRLKECAKAPKLWVYWIVFYLNITAGLAIISHEKVFINAAGCGAYLGLFLILCAAFNTLGRLCVSWSSDYVKHRVVIFSFVLGLSFASCMLNLLGFLFLIPLALFLCNGGYGAMFSTMPCALSDRYGIDKVSEIHGVILSAWAFAGLSGNQIASYIMSVSNGNTNYIFYAAGTLYGIGALLLVIFNLKK